MAVTSSRYITITFEEDITGTYRFNALANTVSVAGIDLVSLLTGDNTITVPSGGGVVTAVTIIPPSTNDDDDDATVAITFKGDPADVGVRLHDVDPSSIALHADVTEFILNVDDDLDDVRLIWS